MSLDTAARLQDVPVGKSAAAAPRPSLGQALKKKLLFLVEREEYLDWQLDDIVAHLGFARGPAQGWDWTTEATTG